MWSISWSPYHMFSPNKYATSSLHKRPEPQSQNQGWDQPNLKVLKTPAVLCRISFWSSIILQNSDIPFPSHSASIKLTPFKIVQHSAFHCVLLLLPLSKHHSHLSWKLYTLRTITEPIQTSLEHSQNVMTSNDYRIVNSQSQRIVRSEVQWAFKEC